MRKIIEFSVKNPLLVNLFSIFLVVAGVICLMTLRREAFPNINLDIVTVRTDYFGAPSEEIEKLIAIKVEDELKEVDGIDEMTSISSENISMVVLELDPDAKDKTKIVNDIQRAVDRIDDLPEDAEDPVVTEVQTKDMPVINVSLVGDLPELELQKYARELETILLDLSDVARIDRTGWRDVEIWVEVDPVKAQEAHLSLKEIKTALRDKNLNLPAGSLVMGGEDYLIRTIGEFETLEEIENVVIRANDQGNWIRVGDVAHVKYAFEDNDILERTFGETAINLTAVKKESGDILTLVEEVRAATEKYREGIPDELDIRYFDDFSYYVNRRLNVLRNNGAVGIIFVVIALFIFLNWTTALMTAIGIPVALLTAVFIMSAFGLTINLITMFALIMVLGLVVDDAIVIAENVYRYAEKGMPPHEAAIKGAEEVALPVVLTVATTIVVFIPMFLMGGIMGKYIWSIPAVVIIALIASLIECLFILPSHLAESVEWGRKKKRSGGLFELVRNRYLKFLDWVLHHRVKFLSIFFGVFIFSIWLLITSVGYNQFPQGLIEQFFIKVKAPIGTSIEETSRRMEHIEKIVDELPKTDLDVFITQVGIMREDPTDPYTDRGSHIGQLQLFLTPEKSRGRRHADDIIEDLRKKIEPHKSLFEEVTFEKIEAGPPTGPAVSVRVRGDDFEVLEEIAEKLKTKLAEVAGVLDIRDDMDEGKKEYRIYIDEKMASKAYLTVRDISAAVRDAIEGGEATEIQETDEEIDVIVRYPDDYEVSADFFNAIYVENKFGNLIPLSKVVEFKEERGINVIKRLDRKRYVSVTADIDEEVTTSLEASRVLEKYFEEEIEKDYPEILMSFGGEREDTGESMQDFRKIFR